MKSSELIGLICVGTTILALFGLAFKANDYKRHEAGRIVSRKAAWRDAGKSNCRPGGIENIDNWKKGAIQGYEAGTETQEQLPPGGVDWDFSKGCAWGINQRETRETKENFDMFIEEFVRGYQDEKFRQLMNDPQHERLQELFRQLRGDGVAQ